MISKDLKVMSMKLNSEFFAREGERKYIYSSRSIVGAFSEHCLN